MRPCLKRGQEKKSHVKVIILLVGIYQQLKSMVFRNCWLSLLHKKLAPGLSKCRKLQRRKPRSGIRPGTWERSSWLCLPSTGVTGVCCYTHLRNQKIPKWAVEICLFKSLTLFLRQDLPSPPKSWDYYWCVPPCSDSRLKRYSSN